MHMQMHMQMHMHTRAKRETQSSRCMQGIQTNKLSKEKEGSRVRK
jgi:hypothetical protein